jgi:hypothetical protein
MSAISMEFSSTGSLTGLKMIDPTQDETHEEQNHCQIITIELV